MHPIKESLDQVSSSFCAAKWLQVTMRLQNGHTHSCHHPKSHKVPLKELEKSPSALHNTEKKKLARKQMLCGERPSECSYCWKVEDLPGDQISDRFIKSGDSWAEPHLEKIASLPWDADVSPTYLEVSFSNMCNFKCAYCHPDISSKVMRESIEHGPYPTSDFFGSLIYLKKEGMMPLPDKENPYIDAFWKWLPEVMNDLKVLRVTGGEPLLSKDCLRLLDYLAQHPNPELTMAINSNFGVPTSLIKKTFEKCRKLVLENKVKRVQFYTSLDTWGEQAEYIRSGLDLDLWKSHMEMAVHEYPEFNYTVMVTYNALSVFKFEAFLGYIHSLKVQGKAHLLIDVSILHDPSFLSLLILPEKFRSFIRKGLDYMQSNMRSLESAGYTQYEVSKMRRLVEYAKTELSEQELLHRRTNFVSFIREYDKRKNVDFLKTFPEMAEDFEAWKVTEESDVERSLRLRALSWGQKVVGPGLLPRI